MSAAPESAAHPVSAALFSPLRIIAAVCIVAPFVAMLWLPSYNKTAPKLLGFPFFYWYQLLWVIITAVLMAVAYLAVSHDRSARRTAGAAEERESE